MLASMLPSSPAGVVRASSIFPILSAILLLLGGVCVASSGFYKSKRNVILGGGILFVAAGETEMLRPSLPFSFDSACLPLMLTLTLEEHSPSGPCLFLQG